MVHKGLSAAIVFLAACSGTEAPVVRPVAQPTSIEATAVQPAATQQPEPTAVPEPTRPSEPTGEVDPSEESASQAPELGSVAIVKPQDPTAVATLPAFIEPPASLTSLVGTVDRGELDEDRIREAGIVGGGIIINVDADDQDWRGLSWGVEGDQVSMSISSFVGRNDDGTARWLVESVWLLQLPPDSDITIGNDVCKADEPTGEYGSEQFFAVTNKAQDMARGAWVFTIEGPVEYEAFADLQCERFIP